VGSRGSAPYPAGGDYSTPDPLARLKALLLEKREGRAEKVEGGKGRGKNREGELVPPLLGRKLRPSVYLFVEAC